MRKIILAAAAAAALIVAAGPSFAGSDKPGHQFGQYNESNWALPFDYHYRR